MPAALERATVLRKMPPEWKRRFLRTSKYVPGTCFARRNKKGRDQESRPSQNNLTLRNSSVHSGLPLRARRIHDVVIEAMSS
jgi:hypothetical protein